MHELKKAHCQITTITIKPFSHNQVGIGYRWKTKQEWKEGKNKGDKNPNKKGEKTIKR